MKKVLLGIFIVLLTGCGEPEQNTNHLPGAFKYLSYHWNNSKDSVGLNLVHYIDIAKDGNYRLVSRLDPDSTGYYYGHVGNGLYDALKTFVADTSFQQVYLQKDSSARSMRHKFDYGISSGSKMITFSNGGVPAEVEKLKQQLDSLINSNGKKQGQVFNINSYLRNLITKDSVLH